jgi:hypothetical protein
MEVIFSFISTHAQCSAVKVLESSEFRVKWHLSQKLTKWAEELRA